MMPTATRWQSEHSPGLQNIICVTTANANHLTCPCLRVSSHSLAHASLPTTAGAESQAPSSSNCLKVQQVWGHRVCMYGMHQLVGNEEVRRIRAAADEPLEKICWELAHAQLLTTTADGPLLALYLCLPGRPPPPWLPKVTLQCDYLPATNEPHVVHTYAFCLSRHQNMQGRLLLCSRSFTHEPPLFTVSTAGPYHNLMDAC